MKHLKVLLKWNWWGNFACVLPDAFSEVLLLKFYSLEIPRESVFGVISDKCLYLIFVTRDRLFFPWNVKWLIFSSWIVISIVAVKRDFAKLLSVNREIMFNSPWTVIFTMSLSFVNCKSTFFYFPCNVI